MLDPAGRVVMISGASRGIGRAVAARLQRQGYRLSLGARRPETLAELAGPEVLAQPYDALARGSAEAWIEATLARFGRIDGLVGNAGVLIETSLEETDDDALETMWRVNAVAPLRLIRLAMPHLRRCGAGRIVTVVSLAGKRVKSDNVGYAMSKHAAMAVTHAARRAGWDDGVRACALCPSFVATDMTRGWASVPRGEMIQPDALAELVATVLALPNTAAVAELLVNCRFEEML